jgi:hypothetical protein
MCRMLKGRPSGLYACELVWLHRRDSNPCYRREREKLNLKELKPVNPVGRGLYRLAKAPALTNPDWINVGLRIPRSREQ